MDNFETELAAASGTLTAAQISAVTRASKRTVEDWRLGRSAPLARYRADILTRIRRARARAERRQATAMQAPNADSQRAELSGPMRNLDQKSASL